jgi:hypothetical protein
LQEASSSLELSLGSHPPSYTPGQLGSIKAELEKALLEYEALAAEAEAEKLKPVEVDSGTLAALLAEIKPLLKKGDFAALEYVEKIRGIAGLEKLAELIDDYDFENALKLAGSFGTDS